MPPVSEAQFKRSPLKAAPPWTRDPRRRTKACAQKGLPLPPRDSQTLTNTGTGAAVVSGRPHNGFMTPIAGSRRPGDRSFRRLRLPRELGGMLESPDSVMSAWKRQRRDQEATATGSLPTRLRGSALGTSDETAYVLRTF